MDIESLLQRLRSAAKAHSLRDLSRMCDVSHERIRRLLGSKHPNMMAETFTKIDKGLKANGL